MDLTRTVEVLALAEEVTGLLRLSDCLTSHSCYGKCRIVVNVCETFNVTLSQIPSVAGKEIFD